MSGGQWPKLLLAAQLAAWMEAGVAGGQWPKLLLAAQLADGWKQAWQKQRLAAAARTEAPPRQLLLLQVVVRVGAAAALRGVLSDGLDVMHQAGREASRAPRALCAVTS